MVETDGSQTKPSGDSNGESRCACEGGVSDLTIGGVASRVFCAAMAVLILASGVGCTLSFGHEPTPDSWETDMSGIEALDCTKIDSALVIPVPPMHRAQSIRQLEHAPAVPLSQQQASHLLDLGDATDGSAPKIIEAAISTLGSSATDQARVDYLKSLAASPSVEMLKPFLVRAIAKNEGTGAFSASHCDDGSLEVRHESLGHKTPPSSRLPIIVFLDRAPKTVHLSWAMAE